MLTDTQYSPCFETTDSSGHHFTISLYKDTTNSTYKINGTWRRQFSKNVNYVQYCHVSRSEYNFWDKEENHVKNMLKEVGLNKNVYYTAEELFEQFKPKQLVTTLENGKKEQR